MKPILFIAPNTKMEQKAKKIANQYKDVEVRLALLDQAIDIVKEAEAKGVEIIISRGGTAKIIKETLPNIPVIEIDVSPYDLIHAIYGARKYGENICIIGFRNILEGVQLLDPILDARINAYYIDDGKNGEKYIKNLINSGEKIDALLGGVLAEKLAYQHDIPTIPLETGQAAIDISIQEARRIVEVARREKEKTDQFQAILHYINEGVISIDQDKNITTFNSAAAKISGVSSQEAIGRPIAEIIKNSRLDIVMKNNIPELGQIFQIGKQQFLANRVPISSGGSVIGAVATLQDVTKVQEYEQRIRAKLSEKGHIAKYSFLDIIGESIPLQKVKEKARKYASNDSTVLIQGESGTGKEMFAQGIHSESLRKNGPFVAVNCAAIPRNLLESELFGYEEGAFTGASKVGKSGLFVEAHNGTIFLDEIGDISMELQTILLRVLQEREVRPVGSSKVIPINVRVIVATNKNLLEEVEKGNFRSDLYYRLNILKLQIPTLRERKEDIKLLSRYFIEKLAVHPMEITRDALEKLSSHYWPGNIRELENVIERLVVLSDNKITADEIEEILQEENGALMSQQAIVNNLEEVDNLEEVKNRHICKVLEECKGNQTLAAERLGISRTHLWRIINQYKK